jgi:hypothetical protein
MSRLAFACLVMAAACSACSSAHGRPAAEGPASQVVEYAFFSRDVPTSVLSQWQTLPPAYREFDLETDARLVFIAGIRGTTEARVQGFLESPRGTVRSSFTRQIRFSPRGIGVERFHHTWMLARLKPEPGEWRVVLYVQDLLVGVFPVHLKGTPG